MNVARRADARRCVRFAVDRGARSEEVLARPVAIVLGARRVGDHVARAEPDTKRVLVEVATVVRLETSYRLVAPRTGTVAVPHARDALRLRHAKAARAASARTVSGVVAHVQLRRATQEQSARQTTVRVERRIYFVARRVADRLPDDRVRDADAVPLADLRLETFAVLRPRPRAQVHRAKKRREVTPQVDHCVALRRGATEAVDERRRQHPRALQVGHREFHVGEVDERRGARRRTTRREERAHPRGHSRVRRVGVENVGVGDGPLLGSVRVAGGVLRVDARPRFAQ
jgi:hypothetical protein